MQQPGLACLLAPSLCSSLFQQAVMNSTAREASRTLKIVLSIVCLALVAGGCVLGVIAYRAIAEAKQSLDWPTVPGRVVRSGVDVSVHRDRTHDSDRRHRETRSYSAAIEYEFEVDGTVWRGTRIAVMSDQFGSRSWAEATTKRFPVGTEVTVSFNPPNPEQCVLEPGRWGGAGFLLIPAVLCTLFPPLVLRAIWSTKPLPTGLHPETRSERMLQGVEVRERILTWEPGRLVHVQRDSISGLKVIGGALIAGLVLGLLLGLPPALFFFSGRGPVFIGQFCLAVSALMAVIGGVWLWLDNRPRTTHIEWTSQFIQLSVGASFREVPFSDVQEVTVTAPQPKRSNSPGQQPQTHAVRVNLIASGKSYIVVESECPTEALRHVRSKLTLSARQLSEAMHVPLQTCDGPDR
jgi:Protein of unknown function (DUF3592)